MWCGRAASASGVVLCLLVHCWLCSAANLLDDTFDYSNPAYWDHRYSKQDGTYDWYNIKWSALSKVLQGHVREEHRVLHLGTGNSALPEQMYKAGFHNQVATDISETVITKMQGKLGHLAPGLQFRVEDATRTGFEAASFDVVVEKGTLEALAADRDCALTESGCEMLLAEKSVVLESFRLLRPGGLFVSVTDEFKPFAELEKNGLERIETRGLDAVDGIPMKRTLYLCFKKGSESTAGGAHLEV
mmetsp:Transcript_90753/g.166647  ORF Transcript_90753/g.166647 Transcript_90753/m.166647 type:complete len:245 (+) Transcript_90753:114-848(+)